MSIDEIIKVTQFAGPFVMTGFATVVLLKERVGRNKEDSVELKHEVREFVKEFRSCIVTLNSTSERQAILQKITNDTINSVIGKLEHLEEKVVVNTTDIAILKQKGKQHA